jgi:acyl dehydratase
MEINYGIENLKFGQPVLVDSEVRLKANLVSIVNLRGVCKATIGAELEIIGQTKPVFKGDVVFLYHFTE